MPISTAYKETLRRRAVQRFVKENLRSPTEAELRNLIFEEEEAYPTVDEVGISGFDLERPRYKDVSSVEMENKNRTAISDDLATASSRLDSLLVALEDSNQGFYATSRRTGRLFDQIEARLDNLLILNSQADVFLAGVEETFDTQDKVDHARSTAQIETNYCTMERGGYNPLDLSQLELGVSTAGDTPIVGTSASGKLSDLRLDNGSIWEYVIYTQAQQGRVSLVLSMELPDPSYVGDLRISGVPVSTNNKMTATCFYSFDGQSFTTLQPAEQVVTPEMVFQLGQAGVKKIQLVFSKNSADSHTSSRNRYMYVFAFDSLKIYSDGYRTSERSELYCGPYELVDELGNVVNFTKASFAACTLEPEGTDVSFYLSKDGQSWIGASHDNDSGNYVSFGDSSASQAAGYLEPTSPAGKLIDEVGLVQEIEFGTEAVLNSYIDSDYVAAVPLRSVVVKRNIVDAGVPDVLLGAVPGWMFDSQTRQYSTTVYVESPTGRYLDLGSTSAYVNGQLVSGQVFLPQGYSVFATADSNWVELDTGIASAEALEAADPLYPFNHKYLVESYPYETSFVGDRVYGGLDDHFGALLEYRSPEEFAFVTSADPKYYRIFTIEDVGGNWYIKTKVNKTDASWKDELFSVDWTVQSSTDNKLYVKAVLTTSRGGQTGRIDSFKVRVI